MNSPSETVTVKAVRFGTSEGVTLTPQFRQMGINVGDQVLCRVSQNTRLNANINHIAQMIENGRYDPISKTFIECTNSDELSVVSTPAESFNIKAGQRLYESVMESLFDFTRDNVDSQPVHYSVDLRGFISLNPSLINQLSDQFKCDDQLNSSLLEQALRMKFIRRLMVDLDLNNSQLELTKSILGEVDKCLQVYNHLLSNKSIQQAVIDDINRQCAEKEVLNEGGVGHYLVIKAVKKRSTSPKCVSLLYDMEFALSHDLILQRPEIRNDGHYPDFPDDNRIAVIEAFGPMSEEQADKFKTYLEIAVDMKDSFHNDIAQIKDFCVKEYAGYKKKMDKDSKGGVR